MPCDHKCINDFLLFGGQAEPRTWVCSRCQKGFRWNAQSGYVGNIECSKCGRTAIEVVFCSNACRTAHDKAKAREEALDLCDYCKNRVIECKHCDGRWHDCPLCGRAPENFVEATSSDESLAQFLKEHPLNTREKELIQKMVRRMQDRLRKKPV